MFSPLRNRAGKRLREPFGKAGLTVATIALVFAMLGGAYAAGALTGKQKKEVEKIAKKLAGKPGAPGANGTNGTNGKDGAPGAAGTNGTDGADGQSVTSVPEPPGAHCAEGGSKLTSAKGVEYICNGQEGLEGLPGEEGSPWTDGGVLPEGSTEVGTFESQDSPGSGEFGIWIPISFPIPISTDTATAATSHVAYGPPEEAPTPTQEEEEFFGSCPGTFALPKATPGYLCVFESYSLSHINTHFVGITRSPADAVKEVINSGSFLEFSSNENNAGIAVAAGSFAVTGCSASLPAGDPNKCP